MVPSGTSLLALVKHLTYVERWWFRAVFAGEDVEFPWTDEDPDADWRVEPHETAEELIAAYRSEVESCRRAIAGGGMDERARGKVETLDGPAGMFSLRWVLGHMIEETARHNGHADILRELIDGATGV
jgi:uncharacterized damage-inducible protein DinB